MQGALFRTLNASLFTFLVENHLFTLIKAEVDSRQYWITYRTYLQWKEIEANMTLYVHSKPFTWPWHSLMQALRSPLSVWCPASPVLLIDWAEWTLGSKALLQKLLPRSNHTASVVFLNYSHWEWAARILHRILEIPDTLARGTYGTIALKIGPSSSTQV